MMGGNMQQMMKQLQKMQQNIMRIQEEAGNKTVEATAGGGVVRVVVSGKKELKELHIAREAVDPEDMEFLQDLIIAAVNEGMQKAEEMVSAELAKVTGGMPRIPGMF